jgi:hypothetical protein
LDSSPSAHNKPGMPMPALLICNRTGLDYFGPYQNIDASEFLYRIGNQLLAELFAGDIANR